MTTLTGNFFQELLKKSNQAIVYDETVPDTEGLKNKKMFKKRLVLKMTHTRKQYY